MKTWWIFAGKFAFKVPTKIGLDLVTGTSPHSSPQAGKFVARTSLWGCSDVSCAAGRGNFSFGPKERRRRRAEKRLSKRVFLESPFLLCSLMVFRTFQVF